MTRSPRSKRTAQTFLQMTTIDRAETSDPAESNTDHELAGAAGERGYVLLALIVATALILIALSVAVPVVARNLRRDRELEAVRRGNQYVRAIQLYYRAFHHYPGSIEQLESTNRVRFLRKRYTDPLTGVDDWHMIAVGANKTSVKGFFGAPLTGLPTGGGLGAVSGIVSQGIGANPLQPTASGAGGTPTGGGLAATGAGATDPTASGAGAVAGQTGGTSAANGAGTTGTAGGTSTGGTTGAAGAANTTGFGPSALTPSTSGGAPFMGVSLGKSGDSIIEWNGEDTYGSWEFLYDPRIELLKQKANALNGGTPGSSLPASNLTPAFGAPGGANGGTGINGTGANGTGTPAGSATPGAGSTSPRP